MCNYNICGVLKQTSQKIRKFATDLVGNRVFDLYLKYGNKNINKCYSCSSCSCSRKRCHGTIFI